MLNLLTENSTDKRCPYCDSNNLVEPPSEPQPSLGVVCKFCGKTFWALSNGEIMGKLAEKDWDYFIALRRIQRDKLKSFQE